MEPYQKVGARYYDATFGRFITRDTDLSQSPYAYCDADPVNESDPSGHLPVNIASPGVPTINGPAGTGTGLAVSSSSGSDDSSSTGYGAVGGDTPSGITGGVTTSGLNSTVSLTSGGNTVTATNHDGNLTGVGASGSLPLGGILSGLSFTFSDLVKFGGVNSQTAGLSYQSGIFKVSLVGSSSGGVTAMAGISTH